MFTIWIQAFRPPGSNDTTTRRFRAMLVKGAPKDSFVPQGNKDEHDMGVFPELNEDQIDQTSPDKVQTIFQTCVKETLKVRT